MFLINDKIYIDVEEYIDINSLLALESEIILGFAKSRYAIKDCGCNIDNQYDKSFKSVITESLNLRDPSNKYFLYYRALAFDAVACRFFMRYTGEYLDMGSVLNIRTFDSYQIQHKGNAEECYDTRAADNFKPLMKWINELEAFDSVGRVDFFLNAPGQPGAIHKDLYTGKPDEFLYFNLHPDRKSLFVLDDDGNKVVLDSRALLFDPRNYHGSLGREAHGWTLRVDGKFNDEWLKKTGMYSHFRE